MTLEEKMAKLKEMQKEQAKKYGEKNTVKLANDLNKLEYYSTGILGMDLMLGGFGIPRGRLISISGTESSCKTTTALTTIATAMKKDKDLLCYYYDAENALSTEYAENLGVDLSRLVVDDTQVAEEGLTKLRDSIASGLYGIAVLDSTNALSPSKDTEDGSEITAVSMAMRARILSNAYPQLVGVCAKNNCTLIVIEQIRQSIGFISTEVNTVGNSGKFYFSQRIMMRRQTKVTEENGVAISNEVKVKTIKNKVAPPFRTCELTCIYGKGFDTVIDTANLAIQLGVVQDKGHSYKKGTSEEKKWSSKDKFVEYLKSDNEFFEKIKSETLSAYKGMKSTEVMQDEDLTDKINAEKEILEDLKVTSKDNSTVSDGSDEFKDE
jgi:recombination protein RecA